ncbi:Uncharacterised protein [Mycobacteroides abscessus subsp. abscessus]|nr:Uncharacterised protein [Mycobacteroides abscessus subsp. abscessus]
MAASSISAQSRNTLPRRTALAIVAVTRSGRSFSRLVATCLATVDAPPGLSTRSSGT